MTNAPSYRASCHCGRVTVAIDALPDFMMDCNCSVCASHGALWGYYAPESATIGGGPKHYRRADKPESTALFHFCDHCGCTSHFSAEKDGNQIIGINMRLFDPELIKGLTVQYGDGRNWDGVSQWGLRRDPSPFE